MTGGRRWFWPLLLGLGLQTFAWNVCAPFLPLRIHDLGTPDLGEVARQAGFLVGLSSLLNTTLATPWAWLGARFGFRWQVLRAHTGTALGWTLMGLARTPLQLTSAAATLGGFSGNYPNYVALATLRASPEQVGRVIGDMQAASQVGMTLGPLLGALIASQAGFRSTFFVSSALSMLAVVMVVILVPADTGRRTARIEGEGIAAAWRRPEQRWLMAIMLIGDAGVLGLRPLIPVFLSTRIDDPAALAAATGITTTLATAGTIAAAILVGRMSQRVAPQSVLVCTLSLAALSVVLVPFATGVPQMMALWTLSGIASGATTPAVFAWLGRIAPRGTGGYTLLANTSMATYAIGPILIGQASATNLTLPFYLAAGATAIAALLALTRRRASSPGPNSLTEIQTLKQSQEAL
jgi:MFS transporter, DHA1 family, multidrug resistance protein